MVKLCADGKKARRRSTECSKYFKIWTRVNFQENSMNRQTMLMAVILNGNVLNENRQLQLQLMLDKCDESASIGATHSLFSPFIEEY